MAEVTTAKKRGVRKERDGIVVSKSGDKSIVVRVETRCRHPQYAKVVSAFKKYHAHDAANEAGIGDHVTITETRPMSRLKRWRLTKIVDKRS